MSQKRIIIFFKMSLLGVASVWWLWKMYIFTVALGEGKMRLNYQFFLNEYLTKTFLLGSKDTYFWQCSAPLIHAYGQEEFPDFWVESLREIVCEIMIDFGSLNPLVFKTAGCCPVDIVHLRHKVVYSFFIFFGRLTIHL